MGGVCVVCVCWILGIYQSCVCLLRDDLSIHRKDYSELRSIIGAGMLLAFFTSLFFRL